MMNKKGKQSRTRSATGQKLQNQGQTLQSPARGSFAALGNQRQSGVPPRRKPSKSPLPPKASKSPPPRKPSNLPPPKASKSKLPSPKASKSKPPPPAKASKSPPPEPKQSKSPPAPRPSTAENQTKTSTTNPSSAESSKKSVAFQPNPNTPAAGPVPPEPAGNKAPNSANPPEKKKGCCSGCCKCCKKGSKAGKVYPELPKPPDSLAHLKDVGSFMMRTTHEYVSDFSCDLPLKFDVYRDDCWRSNLKLYTAEEKGGSCCCNCCKVCCCRTDRSFRFLIKDQGGNHIFSIVRPCGCCCCMGCCFCGDMCGQKVRVELPDGAPIGFVSQKCACCKPSYTIDNAVGCPRFQIVGTGCGFCFCERICAPPPYLPVLAVQDSLIWSAGDKIGAIGMNPPDICRRRRPWNGWRRKNASKFIVSPNDSVFWVDFPRKLDVRLKATMIGAAFLIEFLHFDKDPCWGITQFCC